MLVEKQRITQEGRAYGQAIRVQYPCWNPDEWQFSLAKNSQMILDLDDSLISTKKVKVPPKDLRGRSRMADLSKDVLGLALG